MENIIISDGEWKVMNVLWDNSPCSLATIVKELENDTGWSKATVFVMLKRLIAKNAVSVDTSGKVQLYSPLINKNEATITETQSFLKKVYGGSIGMM
ncbi:MAG: BlaI/MecI/CopY family transcriptional regulator, partial [Clostridia bacterium]|nr:BlaI/MecI/CopY family transcriptional regulator [Clostridia bacterium]